MNKAVENWFSLMNREDILILDTETTGFKPDSEVLQVSVIDTTGKTRFNEYVLPLKRIPPEASKIHGLTEKKLKQYNARPWFEYHERFTELTTSIAKLVLVYNLDFDTRLLRQTCKMQLTPTQFHPYKGRCIMKEYAAYREILNNWGQDWKWHKLADAARYEGARNQPNIHNALHDCEIVLDLMNIVANKVTNKSSSSLF